jgi:DNA-binding NarL/FixJ family response regulator
MEPLGRQPRRSEEKGMPESREYYSSHSGSAYLDPEAPIAVPTRDAVFPESAWQGMQGALRLSNRELQIVQGVFRDEKEECIAYDLGISPHTVNTYFQRLYSKLHVSSRTQLILLIVSEYLTTLIGSSSG